MRDIALLDKIKNIHFIGIGGIGMMGLARILQQRGYLISGSDITESENTHLLRTLGITVAIGHSPKNIGNAQLVCYSSAINNDNCELRMACQRGVPTIKRGQLLALVCRDTKTIVICGSHGKTTTSACAAYLLTKLGYGPNVFIGGKSLNSDSCHWSGENLFVVEADESDGSFLAFYPWIAMITNIDYEHIDYYGSRAELEKSFSQFIDQTKGITIACGDDAGLRQILGSQDNVFLYGMQDHNFVRAFNITLQPQGMLFDVMIGDHLVEGVCLSLIGEYNVLNALAVVTLAWYLGEDIQRIKPLFLSFKGTQRRCQIKAVVEGIRFVDDYAHHPTEIRAVISAMRNYVSQRLVVIVQPHRYSRVQLLLNEFAGCFEGVDCLIVTDIYPAGETPIEGVDGRILYREIKKNFTAESYFIPQSELAVRVPLLLKARDTVLGLGAGSINKIMGDIVEQVRTRMSSTITS